MLDGGGRYSHIYQFMSCIRFQPISIYDEGVQKESKTARGIKIKYCFKLCSERYKINLSSARLGQPGQDNQGIKLVKVNKVIGRTGNTGNVTQVSPVASKRRGERYTLHPLTYRCALANIPDIDWTSLTCGGRSNRSAWSSWTTRPVRSSATSRALSVRGTCCASLNGNVRLGV